MWSHFSLASQRLSLSPGSFSSVCAARIMTSFCKSPNQPDRRNLCNRGPHLHGYIWFIIFFVFISSSKFSCSVVKYAFNYSKKISEVIFFGNNLTWYVPEFVIFWKKEIKLKMVENPRTTFTSVHTNIPLLIQIRSRQQHFLLGFS